MQCCKQTLFILRLKLGAASIETLKAICPAHGCR